MNLPWIVIAEDDRWLTACQAILLDADTTSLSFDMKRMNSGDVLKDPSCVLLPCRAACASVLLWQWTLPCPEQAWTLLRHLSGMEQVFLMVALPDAIALHRITQSGLRAWFREWGARTTIATAAELLPSTRLLQRHCSKYAKRGALPSWCVNG